MHEVSLCQNIIDQINEAQKERPFKAVKKVVLNVGVLSCVEPSALEFAFDVVAKDTPAEGAQLEIKKVLGKAICNLCQKQITINDIVEPCPHCGNACHQIRDGRDIIFQTMEVI